jgi:hypothetical protein
LEKARRMTKRQRQRAIFRWNHRVLSWRQFRLLFTFVKEATISAFLLRVLCIPSG